MYFCKLLARRYQRQRHDKCSKSSLGCVERSATILEYSDEVNDTTRQAVAAVQEFRNQRRNHDSPEEEAR